MRTDIIRLLKKCLLLVVTLCLCLTSSVSATENPPSSRVSKEFIETYFTTIAAASCLGVYNADDAMPFNYLELMGWKIEPHISRSGKLETHFAVASQHYDDLQETVLMVAFRGSATKMDWQTNFETAKVNYGGHTLAEMEQIAKSPLIENGPAVHKGFNTYTDNVLKDAIVSADGKLQDLFQYALNNRQTRIILTGHSMGGAVATLLASRLVDLGYPKERMHVITFGAPAIGNAAYNEKYANKLDILRITNTNDPVPGSLQTFFGGYVQCGRNTKYHLSSQISNIQHDMTMYFDYSVCEYYKQEDKDIAAGRLLAPPRCRIRKGKPVVGLWVESSPNLAKMPLMPDLKRLLIEQYIQLLPSYVLLNEYIDARQDTQVGDAISAAARVGATYVLICHLDSQRDKAQDDVWHLTQEQEVFKSDGAMLSVASFSKKVTRSGGNVQAAGENCLEAYAELQTQLPFLGKAVEATLP